MRIDRSELRLVRLPRAHFFETSFGRVHDKACILVRLLAGGLEAWGECVAEETPYYSAETNETAWHVIAGFLAPRLLALDVEHPRQVFPAFRAPWSESERDLIGKYPELTTRQIQKIFEAKGFSRSVYAISDARTRFGYRSHSEQSRRRNADARSVFKDCETIKDFDFNKLYTRSPCLQCQLREQDKDNYTCGECGFRYHYAQQQHTRWGEDYGQATREIWDTMQYGFVEPSLCQYIIGV